jgi:hypothetical protein
MNFAPKLPLAALILFCVYGNAYSSLAKKPNLFFQNGDFEASIIGKIETETAFDKNGILFNSNIPDKLFANKTKIDISFLTKTPTCQSKVTMRNKVVWGNHKTIFTDDAWLKDLDGPAVGHFHNIGPNMLWVREAWVEADMSKLCKMHDVLKQTLTLGSFSFSLGRGIALGDAYSVNPSLLGFFQDNSVDQYAWGAKLSGGLIKDFMSYDLYLSVLDNKSTSLRETTLPTQVKAYGTGNTAPWRGAGKISFVTAARLMVTPLVEEARKLSFEPYVMHHHDSEQKVEFFCDSKSNLNTAGFACEFMAGGFELGFDCASNFGSQYVKGWDRNYINNVNTGGYSSYVYSDVYSVDPKVTVPTAADNVLYDPANSAQKAAVANVPPGALSNGAQILGTTLYNSLTRYRVPYTTKFKGAMWVGDLSYWLIPKDLVISATGGIATGDQNPNANLKDPNDASVDGNYKGFIPFQELYSGKRVQSFFGMTSLVTRPLNITNTGDDFAVTVDNFSNLKFWGMGIKYKPHKAKSKWNVNPNFLLYWQDVASNTFDISIGKTTNTPANKYIGAESNIFFGVNLSDDLSLTGGIGMLVPGQHYTDIKGKPTTSSQRSALNAALKALTVNPPSVGPVTNLENLPLVGNNTAYSVSIAMGYSF